MRNKAFTLIEVLIGMTLITVVMTAVLGVVLMTLRGNQQNLHTLQATALAQEGLEVMRHIRDSNWLQNYSWDGGAALWNTGFDLDVSDPITLYITDEGCSTQWCFSVLEEDGLVENALGFEVLRMGKFYVDIIQILH